MKDNNLTVSVVITTKNSAAYITDCLESILKQSYKNIEIIVVDNNSKDNTVAIVKKYTDKIYIKGPERSTQRNYGAGRAKGNYLLYLDADMTLSSNVIKECVDIINNKQLIALYIPEIIIGDSFWSRVRNFERSFYNMTVIDAVRFIRRKIFIEVGGFDEKLWGGEDWDFDRRIRSKGQVTIIKSPIYHNEQVFSVKNYVNKKRYYIKSFPDYINKWGKDDPDIKKQLGVYYRFIGVFTEKGKWKKLIVNPHYALSMFFLRIMVGFTYLLNKRKIKI